MEIFKGNCPAIVTPFTSDGRAVNYEVFKRLIDFQIENGVNAIVFLGTTGEASTMTQQERDEVVCFAVEYVNRRVPVIVGAGSNNTAEAIERSKRYEKMGVDALLHVTPYYNKATQKGLIAHYTAIADSVNTPIIMYNVPGRTGVNLLPTTVKTLSGHKNIVAVKEASGNVEQISEIIRICPPDFVVYSGDDGIVLPCLSMGARGVISVASNIVPREMSELCDSFFMGNIIKSRELQLKLNPLIKALFCEVNPMPIKTALNMIGMNVGPVRLPLTEMEKDNEQKLKNVLEEII